MESTMVRLALRKMAKDRDKFELPMGVSLRGIKDVNTAAAVDGVKPINLWDQAHRAADFGGTTKASLDRMFPFMANDRRKLSQLGPASRTVFNRFATRFINDDTPYLVQRLYDRTSSPERRRDILSGFDHIKRGDYLKGFETIYGN